MLVLRYPLLLAGRMPIRRTLTYIGQRKKGESSTRRDLILRVCPPFIIQPIELSVSTINIGMISHYCPCRMELKGTISIETDEG